MGQACVHMRTLPFLNSSQSLSTRAFFCASSWAVGSALLRAHVLSVGPIKPTPAPHLRLAGACTSASSSVAQHDPHEYPATMRQPRSHLLLNQAVRSRHPRRRYRRTAPAAWDRCLPSRLTRWHQSENKPIDHFVPPYLWSNLTTRRKEKPKGSNLTTPQKKRPKE